MIVAASEQHPRGYYRRERPVPSSSLGSGWLSRTPRAVRTLFNNGGNRVVIRALQLGKLLAQGPDDFVPGSAPRCAKVFSRAEADPVTVDNSPSHPRTDPGAKGISRQWLSNLKPVPYLVSAFINTHT